MGKRHNRYRQIVFPAGHLVASPFSGAPACRPGNPGPRALATLTRGCLRRCRRSRGTAKNPNTLVRGVFHHSIGSAAIENKHYLIGPFSRTALVAGSRASARRSSPVRRRQRGPGRSPSSPRTTFAAPDGSCPPPDWSQPPVRDLFSHHILPPFCCFPVFLRAKSKAKLGNQKLWVPIC